MACGALVVLLKGNMALRDQVRESGAISLVHTALSAFPDERSLLFYGKLFFEMLDCSLEGANAGVGVGGQSREVGASAGAGGDGVAAREEVVWDNTPSMQGLARCRARLALRQLT